MNSTHGRGERSRKYGRRMSPQRAQHLAHLDKSLAIEFEPVDGGTACWRDADYVSEFGMPREVIFPTVPSGIEQRRQTPGRGAWSGRKREFGIVARLTGPSHVVCRTCSPRPARGDRFCP